MWTLGRLVPRGNRDPALTNEKCWITGHPEKPGDNLKGSNKFGVQLLLIN